MPGKITALKVQKRNKERVNVYIDDQFAFGLAAIEAMRLQVGQVLSTEEIIQLKHADQMEVAHERALNFLSYRPRSQAEVRRNLFKKDIDESVVDQVIARLSRAGLVDDKAFAHYWVENRKKFKPRGRRALRYELRRKGVKDVIIDEVLSEYDETPGAYQVASKRAARLARRGTDLATFRQKLYGFLKRRGFAYPVIRDTLDQIVQEWGSELANPEEERRHL